MNKNHQPWVGGYVFPTSSAVEQVHICGCIGPQNGQPLCPCAMRGVKIKDGRYVKVVDYGPVEGGKRLELRGEI